MTVVLLCLLSCSAGFIGFPMAISVRRYFRQETKTYRESAGVILPPPIEENELKSPRIPRELAGMQ